MIKPQPKKASKQLVNYLKDPQNMPLSKIQPSIQKTQKAQTHNTTKKYYGPIEGDFLKIGCTYVLQNDRLIKKTPLYGRKQIPQNHNQISNDDFETQNVEVIKQIAKLQYLQKKGFLKPQEMKKLQKLRGNSVNPNLPSTQKKAKVTQKDIYPEEIFMVDPQNEYDSENIDPNMFYQNYVDPKMNLSSIKAGSYQNYRSPNKYEPYNIDISESYNPNINMKYSSQIYSPNRNYF